MNEHSLESLMEEIHYHFQQPELLKQALTHSSYANERKINRIKDYERLEFLGDAVLGVVTAEYLFQNHPDLPEGDLTRIRAVLVCEKSLYEVAQSLSLGSYLKLGKGEESGDGRQRPSILADAVEAMFAAVYLDSDMETVRRLIHRVLLDKEPETQIEERRKDYKTKLQEITQRQPGQNLTYVIVQESGPDHAKVFTVEAQINGRCIGSGSGRSKKEAEQSAARAALEASPEEER